ncbi:MAG: hypothetical protein P4L51_29320 [Puia sp.]|nr:hypothetical protein [Puia sp.]
MSKKVLAIYYTQSGQLEEIIDSFISPFAGSGISVEKVRIRPANDYPFPWTGKRFYSVMPDCVLSIPAPLAPFVLKETSYDLIVLGYQAWFLFPGIPTNSLLRDPSFQSVLPNTPVITITGARNMWINAFGEIKKSLSETGANLVGNIALVDKNPNVISFVTIFHWLLGGKKDRYLNIFPPPGVAEADIDHAKTFGAIVVPYLNTNRWNGMQAELVRNKAVDLKYTLWLLETRAVPTYTVWARFIEKKKKKTAWLLAFKYYLLFALFVGAPILILIDAIFRKPFLSNRIKARKQYFLELN